MSNENVAFAQRVIEKPNRVIKKRVPEVLTLVGLAEKYKSFPKELPEESSSELPWQSHCQPA